MSDYPEEVLNSPKRFNLGTCGDCGKEVKYDRLGINKDECPFCGSSCLQVLIESKDSLPTPKDCLKAKAKDDSFPSAKKVRVDLMTGYEKSRSNGQWVEKTRIIDKDNDRYYEHVVAPETKKVLHHCEESLREHRGHGTERLKDKKP